MNKSTTPNRRNRSASRVAPVVKTITKEVSTADMQVGQSPDIILPNDGSLLVRENEEVSLIDTPLEDDYVKELAFMEDELTIVLHQGQEENPQMVIDVYVNGRAEWIPVDRPYKLKRKYVEGLVRAKSDAVNTDVLQRDGEDPQNIIRRNTRSKHTFSVINDPSPKGTAWLVRLMAER